MHLVRTAALTIATTCLALPAFAQEAGALRSFRDWMAACDNTRVCRAFSLPEASESTGITLGLDREASPQAEPQFFIPVRDQERMPSRGRLILHGSAGPIATLEIGRGAVIDESAYRVTDRRANAAILAEARRAAELTLVFDPPLQGVDGVGPEGVKISLSGASAALLWMDERQKRVGTVTALARPGNRQASEVPPAPPLPSQPPNPPATGAAPQSLAPATLEAVMAAFRAMPGDACDQDDEERGPPSVDRLSARQLLVGVRCWRGAYNFSRTYFIVEEGERPTVRAASFSRPGGASETDSGSPEPDSIIVNGEYDPQSGLINHFSKGRGLGDCGTIGHWRWDGRAFLPTFYQSMPTCRGVLLSNWFTLYRTQEPAR